MTESSDPEMWRRRHARLADAGRRRAAVEGRLLRPVFGYRAHPSRRGDCLVDPVAAPLVQRVFARLAEGVAPATVARELAAEGAPIKTARQVREIARRETYVGLVCWGRTTRKRDAVTGARRPNPVPQESWIVTFREDLAIVSSDLWLRVARSRHPRRR